MPVDCTNSEAVLKRGEKHGSDVQLRQMVERIVDEVVPRLLRKGHLGGASGGITPVVVHGDLWSGNKSRGKIPGRGAVGEVIFDPSACWAHSEFELSVLRPLLLYQHTTFESEKGPCHALYSPNSYLMTTESSL